MNVNYTVEKHNRYISYTHTPSFRAKDAYFYVQGAGHFYCDEGYRVSREGYRSFLIIYTVNGGGYVKYRNSEYSLGKGQVLLIDCCDYHEYCTDKSNLWDIKWLHFSGAGSNGYFNIIYENYGPVVNMPENNSIICHIDVIMKLMAHGDKQFEIKASEVIVKILTEIMLTASNKVDTDVNGKSNVMVDNALGYIEKNYSSAITLEHMANVACSSKYHFIRVFKKHTNYSPYEYLVKYRLNEAKTLLKSTELSVDEIALKVGFASTSNFIKTFRQLEEITPLKFRKFWKEI